MSVMSMSNDAVPAAGKKMWKVLAPIAKGDSKTFWMKLGVAYTNRDGSINLYLDAMPLGEKNNKFQLRDYDEPDRRASATGGGGADESSAAGGGFAADMQRGLASARTTGTDVPF